MKLSLQEQQVKVRWGGDFILFLPVKKCYGKERVQILKI
jgi:hypothetical protein